MSYGYMKTLEHAEYARYGKKLSVIGLEDCPYNIPADSWTNNPTKWPDMQWPDVCNYLINSPGVYTAESMKNYRSLEATNFFISGWVQTVFHLNVPKSKNIVLKANVKPSWRVNDTPHHPWVALNKDGCVITAHCDCMAGLGESCSHIAAILFKIEAAVRNGYTRLACTETTCAWNKCFTKSVQPSPITDIQFYKESSKEKLTKSLRAKRRPPPSASKERQQQFIQELASSGELQVGLSGFKETAHLFEAKSVKNFTKLPKSFSRLYSEKYAKYSQDEMKQKCEEVIKELQVSDNELQYLMAVTKTQSDSLVWHEQRLGKVTASVVHSVLKTDIESPAKSLLMKICHPAIKPLNVPAIMWGREKESTALQQYQEAIVTQHDNVQFERAGLGLFLQKPYIGASPDGLVNCACCGEGVKEIKCPYSHKNSSYEQMIGDNQFYVDENCQLKRDSSYFAQVQLQMYVFNRQFCHFVVWTTETCIILLVNRDDVFIDQMVSHVDIFWRSHCLPELLTHSLLKTATDDTPVPLQKCSVFCYCQKP